MVTRPKTTVLTGHDGVTAPQTTVAGDAPADTWDHLERVSSVQADFATAAAAHHQTVNTVKVVGRIPVTTPSGTREESYVARGPSGASVRVGRNYDTGTTTKFTDRGTVTVVDSTGGTFTLTLGTATTAALDWDATVAEVTDALVALSTLDAADVSVEGEDGGPWTVWVDSEVVGTLTATGTSLVGEGHAVTVT